MGTDSLDRAFARLISRQPRFAPEKVAYHSAMVIVDRMRVFCRVMKIIILPDRRLSRLQNNKMSEQCGPFPSSPAPLRTIAVDTLRSAGTEAGNDDFAPEKAGKGVAMWENTFHAAT